MSTLFFSISLTFHSEPANLHFYLQHISTFCLFLTTSPTSPVQINIFSCSDYWNYFLIALRHLLSLHFHLLACSNQMVFLNIPLIKTFQWLLFKNSWCKMALPINSRICVVLGSFFYWLIFLFLLCVWHLLFSFYLMQVLVFASVKFVLLYRHFDFYFVGC